MSIQHQEAVRAKYRVWRRANGFTSADQVWERLVEIYPEFALTAYRRIEAGTHYPTPTQAKALAQVFGVKVEDLPGPDEDTESTEPSPAEARA